MQDSPFLGEPEPPEPHAARTIAVVTLPEASRGFIRDGDLTAGLDPDLFGHDEQSSIAEVREFVEQLKEPQSGLLLVGLQHALVEEHAASVHFVEQKSGYRLEGVGLEIKDDTVAEEKLFGPMRVMFVSWDSQSV